MTQTKIKHLAKMTNKVLNNYVKEAKKLLEYNMLLFTPNFEYSRLKMVNLEPVNDDLQ